MLGTIYRMQGGEYSSGSRNKSFQQATLTSWYSLLYPYFDETSDIRTDITPCLKEFPRAKPQVTPEGKGLYLTVYLESSPNADIISF